MKRGFDVFTGQGEAQEFGGYFDAKRRKFDRQRDAEPHYSIDDVPTSSLLVLDNNKRSEGTQYNWRQNVGAVLNGGRLELERLYVVHSWRTVPSYAQAVSWVTTNNGGAPTAGSGTIPAGWYDLTGLVAALNALAIPNINFVANATGFQGEPSIDVEISTALATANTFQFVNSPFIKYCPHVHGFSQYLTGSQVGTPGGGGWYPADEISGTVAGATLTFNFGPAQLIQSRFYSIRSQNLTKTQKIHAYGEGVGEDVVGVFGVAPENLGGAAKNTEVISYDVKHSINLSVNNNIGQNVDITVTDEFGNIAESDDPTAELILQFSVSLHY